QEGIRKIGLRRSRAKGYMGNRGGAHVEIVDLFWRRNETILPMVTRDGISLLPVLDTGEGLDCVLRP
ncbi:MAG TPA: hypothetical protein VNA25_17395, partial [Phycisphaerae bacterium]|nr:hypothetical protein [Phycisphaerae bacterium]